MIKIDNEYSTQWVREMKWLETNGVFYDFVKVLNGVTTYKYKKTSKLFHLLAEFYKNR